MTLQACLFSESSVMETGLWCELAEGIDPLDWAHLCRFLGQQQPQTFVAIARKLLAGAPLGHSEPAVHGLNAAPPTHRPAATPLISLGPSGIGGRYQSEYQADRPG